MRINGRHLKLRFSRTQAAEATKYFVRYALQIPTRYERISDSLPHIFLFANRRGGSTLLRDMIYSQPEMNYLDQPFDLTDKQFNPFRRKIPDPFASQFIHASAHEQERIKTYLGNLLSRKYILRSQWNWSDSSFNWKWDRYIVKILNAKALIEFFENEFDCQILYALRHPIPTALSIIKRNWIYTAPAYLKNERFVARYLSDHQYGFSMDIVQKGNPVERHVLEWCLENRVPLLLRKNKPWLTTHFENIVLRPEETSEQICSFFKLTNPRKMTETINKPTRTAWESKKNILKDSAEKRISSWMNKIDRKTAKNCAEIMERYEIEDYRIDSGIPLGSA